MTLSRRLPQTCHISGAPTKSAQSRTESGASLRSVLPSGVSANCPVTSSRKTPAPVSMRSNRYRDERCAPVTLASSSTPPRTVCQMVGDSKRGGDVKRLNSEECIQHLQHLGRCAWRDEGRSRAHGVRIEVCHLTESEVPTSERKTGL